MIRGKSCSIDSRQPRTPPLQLPRSKEKRPEVGEATWEYLKKRMKQLNVAGPDGPCYRTKCHCLRICTAGPIAVVYPEGTWYQNVTTENAERIIQEHLIAGKVVEDLCFARNPI